MYKFHNQSTTIAGGMKRANGETEKNKETLLEDKAPTTPTETSILGQTPPKCIRMRCKGWRRADLEISDRPTHEAERDHWAVLPFAGGTWRPTYSVRAVTSADYVDPHVQEVLDLPVLNLAAAKDEDPDLV